MALYAIKFKMDFPPLNYPLLLLQYIQSLALPSEYYTNRLRNLGLTSIIVWIFRAVQRLASFLETGFKFPKALSRLQISHYPEIKLMSLVIICVKLSYGFEASEDRSESIKSSSGLSMNWAKWQEAQLKKPRDARRSDGLKPSEAIQTKEENIFKMNKRQLDEYMDWYEEMWTKDATKERGMHTSHLGRS